jgi:CO/xanthine dehydrogenase Mo-binding subunit
VTTYAVVGKPVTREDGPEKVSGKTCYSGDLMLPGMLWGKVLRSPLPHARIVRIDTAGASKLPGVHAVLTGRDLTGMLVGRTLRDTPLLAQEKVRFVGEKVAAVAADDVDTAEEALTLIEVEYEELPAIFDPVQAMQPEAPVVHDGGPIYG